MTPNDYYLDVEKKQTSADEEQPIYLFYGLPEKEQVTGQQSVDDRNQQIRNRFDQVSGTIRFLLAPEVVEAIGNFLGSTDCLVKEGGFYLFNWRLSLNERLGQDESEQPIMEQEIKRVLESNDIEMFEQFIEALEEYEREIHEFQIVCSRLLGVSSRVSGKDWRTFIFKSKNLEPEIRTADETREMRNRIAGELSQARSEGALNEVALLEIAVDALTRRMVRFEIKGHMDWPPKEKVAETYIQHVEEILEEQDGSEHSSELDQSLLRTIGKDNFAFSSPSP
jgi:hypothetical protein